MRRVFIAIEDRGTGDVYVDVQITVLEADVSIPTETYRHELHGRDAFGRKTPADLIREVVDGISTLR